MSENNNNLSAAQEKLPEDTLTTVDSQQLTVDKREELEPAVTVFSEQSAGYIGRERRTNLDQQIETLYNRTVEELNHHPADVALALKKLNRAQGLVLEHPRRYNEALNQVAEVKMMLIEKRTLRQWSYTWGLLVFFYAIVWFVILGLGFLIDINQFTGNRLGMAQGYSVIWYCALAGGIGGVVAILYTLSQRVAKNQFDRQEVMMYLVQPVVGLMLGVLIFFIAHAGFLLFGNDSLGAEGINLSSPQLFLILLGWIAGFRQSDIYNIIDNLVARLVPKHKTET